MGCDKGIPKPIVIFVGVGLPVGMLIGSNGTAYLEPALMGGVAAGAIAVILYEGYYLAKDGIIKGGVQAIAGAVKSGFCAL